MIFVLPGPARAALRSSEDVRLAWSRERRYARGGMPHDGSPSSRSAFGASEGVPRAGQIIAAKYEIERVLGAGGMGVVVAARHLQLGQRVAIKFIRAEAAADRNALERFLREARAAVALTSQHVTKVLDVGTLETGAPYMVMEYLDGVDLGELLRRNGAMSVADATGAVLQASEAIGEAHSLGIVHRDLKPANLFVTKSVDGGPLIRVLDFGISKMTGPDSTDGGQSLTASGLVMGSPGYMSPEQVRSAKEVDPRSDIWALGVILYELLSGVQPFRGTTMGETFARILTESPVPVRTLRADVPEGLATAISQCLQRDREQRIQSIGELASKLLPFGPPDAARSVERILRVLGGARQAAPRQETLAAEVGRGGGTAPFEAMETNPAWLRSSAAARPKTHGTWGVAIIVSAILLAFSAAAGLYVLKGRTTNASASAPSAASPLPDPPAPAKPPLAVPGTPSASVNVSGPSLVASIAIASDSPDAGQSGMTTHAVHRVPPSQLLKTAPPKTPASNPSATTMTTHETDVF
jgi:serine/threonine protein kinase